MSLFGELGTRKELENKAKAEGRLPPQSLTAAVLHYGSIHTLILPSGTSRFPAKSKSPSA
jgi:hypothetical protein